MPAPEPPSPERGRDAVGGGPSPVGGTSDEGPPWFRQALAAPVEEGAVSVDGARIAFRHALRLRGRLELVGNDLERLADMFKILVPGISGPACGRIGIATRGEANRKQGYGGKQDAHGRYLRIYLILDASRGQIRQSID